MGNPCASLTVVLFKGVLTLMSITSQSRQETRGDGWPAISIASLSEGMAAWVGTQGPESLETLS
jgi:hypothetical protein